MGTSRQSVLWVIFVGIGVILVHYLFNPSNPIATFIVFILGNIGSLAVNKISEIQGEVGTILTWIYNDRIIRRFCIGALIVLLFLTIRLPQYERFSSSFDPGLITYVIDNSGSMGCLNSEDRKYLNNDDSCEENPNLRVEIAKKWILDDFRSRKLELANIGLLEIGGETVAEGSCQLSSLLKLGLNNSYNMRLALDNVVANSSGATNLGGAIKNAANEMLLFESKLSSEKLKKQILLVTDLGHNCQEADSIPIGSIKSELEGIGFDINAKDITDITVFAMAPEERNAIVNQSNTFKFASENTELNDKKTEMDLLSKAGINVIPIADYKSAPYLPQINGKRSLFEYMLVFPIAFSLSEAALRLSKEQPPSASSRRGQTATEAKIIVKAKIKLSWEYQPNDLDLYLIPLNDNSDINENSGERIFFRSRGSLRRYPWAKLEEDIRSAPGTEIINVERKCHGKFLIAIHNYSELPSIRESRAVVHILTNDNIRERFECPQINDGLVWNVCIIDFSEDENTIYEINYVSNSFDFT